MFSRQKLSGALSYVAPTVSPETRTVRVHLDLPNAQREFKPHMLASMLIEAKPVDRLVVPASAVVRESDEDHVFVAEGDGGIGVSRAGGRGPGTALDLPPALAQLRRVEALDRGRGAAQQHRGEDGAEEVPGPGSAIAPCRAPSRP